MIYAAILGGGSGTRFGGSLPKQFAPLGEQTVLEHAVAPFYHCSEIAEIVVVLPKKYLLMGQELLYRAFCDKNRIKVTAGGEDRLESLENACRYFAERGADDAILLTHDAARPFVTEAMIRDQLTKIKVYDCATAAIPAVDTVLCSPDGAVAAAIPQRKTMFQAQTPQTFYLNELYRELQNVTPEERAVLTDGTGLFLLRGKTVGLALGDRKNLKITTAEDLAVAKAYL